MATKLRKSGKEVAKQSWAKTDVRYWEAAVFKPKFSRRKDSDGEELGDGVNTSAKETKHYSVRISHQGTRHTIPLAMANKGDAARRARDIYLSLVSSGWQETLEKFHPHHINRPAPGQDEQEEATLGAYIDLAKTLTGVAPRSISGYITSLRMIAASVAGIKSAASRFDYKKGGRDECPNPQNGKVPRYRSPPPPRQRAPIRCLPFKVPGHVMPEFLFRAVVPIRWVHRNNSTCFSGHTTCN